MTRRRAIKSVLHNLLGTYTSRYSDLDGYWLFGLLVEDVGQVTIDLMDTSGENADGLPIAVARRLAVTEFAEQMEKARLTMSRIRNARINMVKSADSRRGVVNGHVCSGYELTFVAQAVTDLGKTYDRQMTIFVAPHDPEVEFRSTRAT
jgi:hypothetical protein